MKSHLGFLILLFFLGLIAFGIVQFFSGNFRPDTTFSFLNLRPALNLEKAPPRLGEDEPSGSQYPAGEKAAPPEGFSEAELSPWYGRVKINSFRVSQSLLDGGGFALSADYSLRGLVDVTGWKIKANRWDVVLPQAAPDYQPYGLLANGDITLSGGGSVRAQYGISPIGKNIRPNSCFNYISAVFKFEPQLPSGQCAAPYTREEISVLPGDCQSLLLSLQYACRGPSDSEKQNLTTMEYNACRPFFDRLTYERCRADNYSRVDFFSKDWYVWLASRVSADPAHDRILLLDKDGLLVDQYIY